MNDSARFWVVARSRLLLLVLVLVLPGCSDSEAPADPEKGLDFGALPLEYPDTAPEKEYVARDGVRLPLRHYASVASTSLILIHGSGTHNVYLSGMAAAVASAGAADVYTPDLRGHGRDPQSRGDIDYIDQLDDDIADLVEFIRDHDPDGTIVLGGHSSGGGLAIRFAGRATGPRVDGYLLLAPFLQHNAPTVRPRSGGWANPKTGRIIGLSILNGFGIRGLNGMTVLEFELPEARRTGNETLGYSYRLMTGFAPRDYRADLQALCEPTLVLVGSEDEAFHSDRFAPTFAELAPEARVEVLAGVQHLGITSAKPAQHEAIAWLLETFSAGAIEACR